MYSYLWHLTILKVLPWLWPHWRLQIKALQHVENTLLKLPTHALSLLAQLKNIIAHRELKENVSRQKAIKRKNGFMDLFVVVLLAVVALPFFCLCFCAVWATYSELSRASCCCCCYCANCLLLLRLSHFFSYACAQLAFYRWCIRIRVNFLTVFFCLVLSCRLSWVNCAWQQIEKILEKILKNIQKHKIDKRKNKTQIFNIICGPLRQKMAKKINRILQNKKTKISKNLK